MKAFSAFWSGLSTFHTVLSLVFLWTCLPVCSLVAQLSVTPNKLNATYGIGEEMAFHLESDQSGPILYTIWYDRFTTPLAEAIVNHTAGNVTAIPFVLDKQGVVMCVVQQNGVREHAAAAFAPYDIRPLEQEPASFDDFWKGQMSTLADVPMDPKVQMLQVNEYSTTYSVQLGHIDNRTVYGYLVVPTGDGPFPAAITMPSYGENANLVTPEIALAERANMLSMSISIHNAPPDQVDPNAYEPDVIDDPMKMYNRYAILAGVRAIDYLVSRPDFNGDQVAAFGVSQGAGLALQLAGLDQRVNLLAFSNPSNCQHLGLKYDQPMGFPFYLWQSIGINGGSAHFDATIEATKFYDAVYFAQRYKGPVMAFTSLKDETAQAGTQMAAINQLQVPKIHMISRDLIHQQNPDEYWQGRFEFIRQHFPAALDAPWPWRTDDIGFSVSTEDNRLVDLGETISLEGTYSYNREPIDKVRFEWRLESGPGIVNFSNRTGALTNATFNTLGKYLLSFSAMPDTLNDQGKFYRLTDYVEVEVKLPLDAAEAVRRPIKVFPNPAQDLLQVDLPPTDFAAGVYEVFDINGKKQLEGRFQNPAFPLSTATLEVGVYHLKLHMENQYAFSTRFMVLR
ncbi:MAG: acetylxylan esterase [Bacteroidota bacterium]